MMRMEDIKPVGNFILIKFEKVPDTKVSEAGIITVTPKGQEQHHALIHKVGKDVQSDEFKIGDKVIFDEYGAKVIELENDRVAIIKPENVFATY